MEPVTTLGFLLVASVVGALIGAVGVGGVLLAPALVIAGGQDAQAATAVSSWVFIFTGIAGTWRYGGQGSIPWSLVSRVAVGVVPSALAGAFVNRLLPGDIVLALVAAIALFSGVTTLWASPRKAPQPIGSSALMGLGAAVGFGSAVNGTGGPILLMPALLVAGIGARAAVAASQVLQLPVVIVASAGFLGSSQSRV